MHVNIKKFLSHPILLTEKLENANFSALCTKKLPFFEPFWNFLDEKLNKIFNNPPKMLGNRCGAP
uniref:Uncharacterized protein n=1 Tax=Romanomermis culicivorax TaxID=13658 RepID=A0A915IEE1_ROMCU